MAKITLCEPKRPYNCTIDTGVMNVEIKEAFLGVRFISDSGEKLSVCMRDGGFEVLYFMDSEEGEFSTGWTEFKNGVITANTK